MKCLPWQIHLWPFKPYVSLPPRAVHLIVMMHSCDSRSQRIRPASVLAVVAADSSFTWRALSRLFDWVPAEDEDKREKMSACVVSPCFMITSHLSVLVFQFDVDGDIWWKMSFWMLKLSLWCARPAIKSEINNQVNLLVFIHFWKCVRDQTPTGANLHYNQSRMLVALSRLASQTRC